MTFNWHQEQNNTFMKIFYYLDEIWNGYYRERTIDYSSKGYNKPPKGETYESYLG